MSSFAPILVVCVGNICRSPVAERALNGLLPELEVASAGLAAVRGAPADQLAADIAAERGVSLDGHVARQFNAELGSGYRLILAMEPAHRSEIMRRWPQLSGRTMLFDQWTGAKGIADPYRRSPDFHRVTRDLILAAAKAWAERLQA